MKSIPWTFATLILIYGGIGMSGTVARPESPPTRYLSSSRMTSKHSNQDFVPDGMLDNPSWQRTKWVKFDRDAFGPAVHPEAATEIASLWTASYVYFGYRCKYTTLNVFEGKEPTKDFWTLWERDVVEVFLNPQPERMRHYYEFEVAPNNLWIDLEIDLDKKPFNNPSWNSGFEHATHIDAAKRVWTCEMRIPLSAMKVTGPLKAGAKWRVNFFRADGLGGEGQRRLLSWSPVQSDSHSFHSPWSFGEIQFVH